MGSRSTIESNKDKRIAFELISQRREQKIKSDYEKSMNQLEIEKTQLNSEQLINKEKKMLYDNRTA